MQKIIRIHNFSLQSHNLASLLSNMHILVAVTKIRGTEELHIFVCIRKNDTLIQETRPKQKVLLLKKKVTMCESPHYCKTCND